MTTLEACLLAVLFAKNNVRSRGAIAEVDKTGFTYLYLKLRSVKAVVARDTILVEVCRGSFESTAQEHPKKEYGVSPEKLDFG